MSILHQAPSETKMRMELKKILFGKKLFCPRCGSSIIRRYEKRYRCKSCRKPFSLTSVTWLKGMKLPLQTFWLLLWCYVNKVPIDQTMKACGVSILTVRRWFDKFRDHLPHERLESMRLSGIVQMDEAYRGGKNKGYSIVAAKEKAKEGKRRKMALEIIPKPSVDRRDALMFLVSRVVPSNDLHTDGAEIYQGIGNWWPVNHKYELHNRWEFALTSEIEGLFGNFTTFIRRMYHHVTREKVNAIAQEFVARSTYPEWFYSPESFLKVAIQPLMRPAIKKGRKPKKIQEEIYTPNFSILPLYSLPKSSTLVPSC